MEHNVFVEHILCQPLGGMMNIVNIISKVASIRAMVFKPVSMYSGDLQTYSIDKTDWKFLQILMSRQST